MVLQIYEVAVSILIVCIQADVRSLTRCSLSAKKRETIFIWLTLELCQVTLHLNGLHIHLGVLACWSSHQMPEKRVVTKVF